MFMSENKKIEILGQHNRYNIKKANKEKKIKNKLNDSLKILLNKKNLQIEHLNTLYMVDSINLNVLQKNILREIEKKRNSYKNQDIKKNKLDDDELIKTDELIEKLVVSKLKCCYCKEDVELIYENYRDNKQWTLDRINNDIGHNKDNVVISCLGCNLKRRTMDKDDFEYSKNLKVIKEL
jgi:hypothetical protein